MVDSFDLSDHLGMKRGFTGFRLGGLRAEDIVDAAGEPTGLTVKTPPSSFTEPRHLYHQGKDTGYTLGGPWSDVFLDPNQQPTGYVLDARSRRRENHILLH
ncbi:MAG TPA: hypothetical protein VJI15_05230 [Candidatus Nanoarchaeia archaeon]|nr:hypothetical protein [Candidatus Nanoarchaeia archaeon]